MNQKQIVPNTGIVKMIRSTVHAQDPQAQIILYGSRARGTQRNDSDWDILILVDNPNMSVAERGALEYALWDKGMDMGQEVNATAYTKSQWESAPPTLFKHNVINEGVLL